MTDIKTKLEEIVGSDNLFMDEKMAGHTTFRVGGPADFLVTPSVTDIGEVVKLCKAEKVPYFIFGNGSNLLVSDEGIRGVVIEVGKKAADITLVDFTEDKTDDSDSARIIEAEAGALLSSIASLALKNSLTGFEFAAGIPGSLGGAVAMNAGAYGGEMKDVLVDATVYDIENDKTMVLGVDELDLSYRRSLISEGNFIVLSARIKLTCGNSEDILSTMNELKEKRVSKQPLEYPSAGSTFKRPEGYFAGKLIEDAGLRGYTVGGAQVSEKHCGFVINKGNATAQDIYSLICDVKRKVKEDSGVTMEPEVKIIGRFK
ncbi:MAG: UDP-N-acetylmuramate dehydrogenase [Lachnospiraceae bacterium]|nr:UDP-N-acetylmuramate dehydrogenase [Lachnospiraceae bacterium]